MALDTSIIINALTANVPNPTTQQTQQIQAFADAIKQFVLSLEITYTTGLANSGGPVTGAFGNTLS